jgi:hypothetical protein
MVKVLIVGPVTKDRIVKGNKIYNTVGGAVYYQSAVFSEFGIDNTVLTTLNPQDNILLDNFPRQTEVIPVHTMFTMEFENIYPDDDPNHRIQKAKAGTNSLKPADFKDININEYQAILLSPLTPYDIPLETIKYLTRQDKPLYMGVQGYLRHIMDSKIILKPWREYKNFLKYMDIIFLDTLEAKVLIDDPDYDLSEIAFKLSTLGPEEVIITRGDQGAVVYSQRTHEIYEIPSNRPEKIVNPTGLGDTFMAAYALKKLETSNPMLCASFAARISSEKMGQLGAYKKNK